MTKTIIHWKPGFIHIVNSNTFRHPICWSSCKSECVNVVCVNRWQFLFTDQFYFIYTRFAHRRNADEFIKERERYATIGDDLDFAFVGQILNCFHWLFDFVYRSQFEMNKNKMFQLISIELIGVEMVYNDRHPKPPTPIHPPTPPPPKEPTPPGNDRYKMHKQSLSRSNTIYSGRIHSNGFNPWIWFRFYFRRRLPTITLIWSVSEFFLLKIWILSLDDDQFILSIHTLCVQKSVKSKQKPWINLPLARDRQFVFERLKTARSFWYFFLWFEMCKNDVLNS